MLLRSHSERRPLPGFSALLSQSSTLTQKDEVTSAPPPTHTPRESIFTPASLISPPPWVSQALANLEQGEQELLTLRERQQNEVEEVNRQLDNAVFEAQREERRLLEKIEQDHRDAQRRLDQVKRENAAAVRVVQSMVDQQIRNIVQLKEQVKRWGGTAGGANKNQLQRGVAEVTDIQKNLVQQVSPTGSERSCRISNFFDVAVNSCGLIALTCAAERAVLVFSRHGRLLQTFGGTLIGSSNEELDAPRGVTVNQNDEFLVADIKRGSLTALKLDPKTGVRLERTVVTGYHRPYLVAACLSTGLMAVSERGSETGRVPCIRVLDPGWSTIRILGVCSGLGPVLSSPWGLCIDSDGDVLVADWGKQYHRVLIYPSKGVGWPLVNDTLSSPRGLALLPDGHMALSDSMNHCIKIYRYKSN
uniref:Uncharacterized protein n=1 Tax=Knipowitschia caucasica TaxID=637954 RepID=A0AAV2LCZ8_KNICA